MNEEGTARSEAPVGRRQPVGASRRMIRPAGRGPRRHIAIGVPRGEPGRV